MGYTTTFEGRLNFNRVLTVTELNELNELASYASQEEALTRYPGLHPDSYNQWQPSKDGLGLEWNGGEKFYEYVEWLQWLIDKYLSPRNITLNGILRYQGEEIGDVGRIEVENSKVQKIKLDPTGMVECPNCGERFRPE